MRCDPPVATAAALSMLSRDYGEQLIAPHHRFPANRRAAFNINGAGLDGGRR